MTPTLDHLKDMAYRAGVIARDGFNQDHNIVYKSEFDVVTEIDHRSEECIINSIHSQFLDHFIITEERGEIGQNKKHTWYIDPIDGTINYAHSVPYFGISIAYAENNIIQLGVIYQPITDEMFCAQKGTGASLNGKEIHVSSSDKPQSTLLATEYVYGSPGFLKNQQNIHDFDKQFQGVRRCGSCTIDLAYVAGGRYEGFWTHHAHAWDFAAGALIVMEAGGIVTDIHGGQDFLTSPCTIIAANPNIHTMMLKTIDS